jgi:branched-chain amino acid transport system permease protein
VVVLVKELSMIVTILDIVIAGLLLGGLYALIAMGLSLQYGVARVLNISHGEFIMLGALTTWLMFTAFGINPLLGLFVCAPLAYILGYILHRTMFKRLLATSASPAVFEANSMLASFGLLFIIRNLALIGWGSEAFYLASG